MAGRRQDWTVIAKGRPYLHPTLGHPGQNAPKKILRALSGPEGDVNETIRRFARATRRQPVEHVGVVHPLSGRMVGMARGHELGVAPPVVGATRTQRKLAQFAERHAESRPDLAARANLAAVRAGGPRPIVVHNHPTIGSHTRHMPSALDLGGSFGSHGHQSRVITLEPHTRRGAPKSRVTTFGYHPGRLGSDEGAGHLIGLTQHDLSTTPPGVTHRIRQGKVKTILPLQRRIAGISHSEVEAVGSENGKDAAESLLEARRDARHDRMMVSRKARPAPQGSDYDGPVRELTRGRKARQGGFYTREQMMKRYEGPRRVAPSAVGKRLVDEESHTSLIRGIGLGTGMGAIAWGGSRLKYLGPALRAGKEIAAPVNPRVADVLRHAEGLRRTTERTTTPLGRITGRGVGAMPPSLRAQLERVPRDLRPATATLAGAILVQRSTPVREKTYRPVGY